MHCYSAANVQDKGPDSFLNKNLCVKSQKHFEFIRFVFFVNQQKP